MRAGMVEADDTLEEERNPKPDADLLSVEDLRTWFDTPQGMVRAVDGVSFRVDKGETVGFVGESGSGKTQTFFSLLGLTHGLPGVVAGRATWKGRNLLAGLEACVSLEECEGAVVVRKDLNRWRRLHERQVAPVRGRGIGLLFQEPRGSLVPYWSVGRHFEGVRRSLRPSLINEVVDDLLVRLGFRDPRAVRSAFPEELSGGEAQRVMLALALSAEPDLLVADEPTTALDAISQRRLLSELATVADDDALALVVISHDLSLVLLLAERIHVMFGGRIVERLSAEVLMSAPDELLHPYTVELRRSHRARSLGTLPSVGPRRPAPASHRGCAYAARCELRSVLPSSLAARCTDEAPVSTPMDHGHELACWGRREG